MLGPSSHCGPCVCLLPVSRSAGRELSPSYDVCVLLQTTTCPMVGTVTAGMRRPSMPVRCSAIQPTASSERLCVAADSISLKS
jgi:hypothetical protein